MRITKIPIISNKFIKILLSLNSNLIIKELEITFTEQVASHATCKAFQIGKLVVCTFYLTSNNGTDIWYPIATLPVKVDTAPNFAWCSYDAIYPGSVDMYVTKVDGVATIGAYLDSSAKSHGRCSATFAFTVL